MICCGLVAFLAVILCQVLFLPMRKRTGARQTRRGSLVAKQAGNLCEIFRCCKSEAEFFAPNFGQILRPRFFRQHNLAPDFAPVWRLHLLSALKPQETGDQALLGRPLPPLSLRAIICRPAITTGLIRMKNRGREQKFSEQRFFHYKILRTRFCGGGAALAKMRDSLAINR